MIVLQSKLFSKALKYSQTKEYTRKLFFKALKYPGLKELSSVIYHLSIIICHLFTIHHKSKIQEPHLLFPAYFYFLKQKPW